MKTPLKAILSLMPLLGLLGTPAQAKPTKKVRIALIVESTVDDKGWCQAMHDAITAVQKKYGPALVEYSHSEKMKPVDAGSAARQYVNQKYDIIICHGAQYKNLVTELAPDFPNTSFAYGTNADIGGKNVFTYVPYSEETGYLNGIIAGMVTKTNIIGNVGSVDGGDSARYSRGFDLGVKSVNPKAKILHGHTGSFGDFVKAGELAQAQLKASADVLTGSSQQAMGALRAVAESTGNVHWVGQDINQLNVPEGKKALACAGYNYAAVVEGLIDKREAGIKGGENLAMRFTNDGFRYQFSERKDLKVLTPAVRKAVEQAKADLKSGKLKLDWKAVKL